MHIGRVSSYAWMLMPFIGVPVGMLYEKKRAKKGTVRTHYDMHIAYMWWGYGINVSDFYYILCIYSQISPVPFILLITGLVTFATGQNDTIYTPYCRCINILGMCYTLFIT
jgi:hypothetical protein